MAATIAAGSVVPAVASAPSPSPSNSTSLGSDITPGKGNQKLTFGLRPWYPDGGQPRGTFHYQLAAGSRTNDRISVFNFARVPLTFQLYGADAHNTDQGAVAIEPKSAKPTDAGSWVKFSIPSASLFRVTARTRFDVGFTITVPANAAPGDHVAAIVLSLPARTRSPKGATFNVDSRVGALLTIRIAGQVHQQLVVTLTSVKYVQNWNPLGPGDARVTYRVRNKGNVVVGADQRVTIVGPFGSGRVQLPARIASIVPGDAASVTVRFRHLWPLLHYTDRALVSYVPAVGDPSAQPVVTTKGMLAMPWPQILSVLGLLLLWRVRRWRRRPGKAGHAGGRPSTDQLVRSSV